MIYLTDIGRKHGHFKFKENRAQKLALRWRGLERKMARLIQRGNGQTLTARCAYGVLLMMETGIRVGNESSAEGFICTNKYHAMYGLKLQTYGLTTLKVEHVTKTRSALFIDFIGKKGVQNSLTTSHPVLMRFFDNVRDTFRDYEETAFQISPFLNINAYELTKFVKKRVGRGFSPKDIRTAKVNLMFLEQMKNACDPDEQNIVTKKEANELLSDCIEYVATEIGHTKAVCRSAYITKPLLAATKEWLQEIIEQNRSAE